MKRTGAKDKQGLKLKTRLQLVRTTIRELTPEHLTQVQGGNSGAEPSACQLWPLTAAGA